MENYTQLSTDFTLLGLLPTSKIGLFLFIIIVLIFLMALIGNLSMILLILLDNHLHTPMYFLLSQLSLVDLNYISTIVPKMAYNFLFGNKSISFIGCGVQSFFFLTLAGAETLLLTSMAYDRYVAICFPLHYPIRMNKNTCVMMIIVSWLMGSINSCAHTAYAFHIPYCQSRAINHFFCDVPAMLTLACMDTWVYEYTVFVSTTLFLVFPFIGITFSYGRVFLTVYRMPSSEGRKKAYSTCSAHLTVVTLFYAPFAYTYLRSRSYRSPTEDKILAVFYTIITPMLNPVIYSLRNKEVMGALRKIIHKIFSVEV
ncbi:PREDICTED: olfactory receptor 2L5-like [Elephantulus edwardii]|uniref:olfactory receptor 2L5-like n=1 Tax=Elephantulus edwardii TaxID=28737 RepID=UPI0003F0AE45|nr:PREDICTED: olfactory receptor 2L5-like [Elephantulus edwardii]